MQLFLMTVICNDQLLQTNRAPLVDAIDQFYCYGKLHELFMAQCGSIGTRNSIRPKLLHCCRKQGGTIWRQSNINITWNYKRTRQTCTNNTVLSVRQTISVYNILTTTVLDNTDTQILLDILINNSHSILKRLLNFGCIQNTETCFPWLSRTFYVYF